MFTFFFPAIFIHVRLYTLRLAFDSKQFRTDRT